jgi:hypothetical protein
LDNHIENPDFAPHSPNATPNPQRIPQKKRTENRRFFFTTQIPRIRVKPPPGISRNPLPNNLFCHSFGKTPKQPACYSHDDVNKFFGKIIKNEHFRRNSA